MAIKYLLQFAIKMMLSICILLNPQQEVQMHFFVRHCPAQVIRLNRSHTCRAIQRKASLSLGGNESWIPAFAGMTEKKISL
jgi:hypothetical protein